ncbi:MAG TPA: glycosyltransferase [Candidatus Ozemobacteraceae bacterium]|nr:glycosyltransferase [Candidatus Ozemobacteraceae bacterium]
MTTSDDIQISVVVPAYNRPAVLADCLEALSAQVTSRSWEVIVVDDGSVEDLSPIEASFRNRLNLTWVRLAQNGGPARARNAGIAKARGELVFFTDADCRPEPGWIEELSKPFEDPAVTGAKGRYRTSQTDVWARLAQLEFEERFELLSASKDIDFVDTYSGAFRRGKLNEVGGFDMGFSRADNEDVDLSFRIKALGGRFVFVPRAVVWHRHREGVLNYFLLKVGRGYWRMRVYRRHPEKAGRDSYTPLSMKAQLVMLAAAPLLFLYPRFWRALVPGWLITCIPLARLSLGKDPGLLPWTPVLPLVRGAALLIGMLRGGAAVLRENLRGSSR